MKQNKARVEDCSRRFKQLYVQANPANVKERRLIVAKTMSVTVYEFAFSVGDVDSKNVAIQLFCMKDINRDIIVNLLSMAKICKYFIKFVTALKQFGLLVCVIWFVQYFEGFISKLGEHKSV